jgi:hypothetical protein
MACGSTKNQTTSRGDIPFIDLREIRSPNALKPFVGRYVHLKGIWGGLGKPGIYVENSLSNGVSYVGVDFPVFTDAGIEKTNQLLEQDRNGQIVEVDGTLQFYPGSHLNDNGYSQGRSAGYFFNILEAHVEFLNDYSHP